MDKTRRKKAVWIFMGILIIILSASMASADFYVIGTKRAKNTILVSPKSTETDSGTALLDAVDSTSDASSSNRYLILVEPGVYDVGSNTLDLDSYVSIEGAGQQATKITGGRDGAIISKSGSGAIRFLMVENTGAAGTGDTSNAISINVGSPDVSYVTAEASGGDDNNGITIALLCSPVISNVTAEASGGDQNCGIQIGFLAVPTLKNSKVVATGGVANYGLYLNNGVEPIIRNLIAEASGGSGADYGVYISDNSGIDIVIESSKLTGDSDALNLESGHVANLFHTLTDNGFGGAGEVNCRSVYDYTTGGTYTNDCHN